MTLKPTATPPPTSPHASRDQVRLDMAGMLTSAPMEKEHLLRNLGLFVLPMEMKRFLFFNSIYERILNTPGVIIEFGVRWGQNLAVLQSLRAIYEPYNRHRKIIGFDTFEGFPSVDEKDGNNNVNVIGNFSVQKGYELFLEKLLQAREMQSPLETIKKFEIVKGDAPIQLEAYLSEHPETIVSFAYFDMDLYAPTLRCLDIVKKHLTKGSIIGFDELGEPDHPGETRAVQESLGLSNIRLLRNQWCANETFYVVE